MTIKEKAYPDLVEILTQENEDLKNKYSAEHKSRQEAEGELTIVKTITIDSSPEMRDAKKKIEELQNNLDKTKKDNNDLYNRIAKLIEDHKKEVTNLKWIKNQDYIFLVDENKKLHKEVEELKGDNKTLAHEVADRVDQMRKSGM